jgi:pimeloyl-ACP methyl ester carboxylesterase
VAGDTNLGTPDIFVHSFSTPYSGPAHTIDELVEQMKLVMDGNEVFPKHGRVIFVCHSMGGLVVRGFLRRYQRLASQVPLIVFLATPTGGAQIANLASLLSRNPQLGGMLPAGADNYTRILERDWRAAGFSIVSKCGYETRDIMNMRIVDETSAASLCDGPPTPIDADHIDIAKPADRHSESYMLLQTALRELPANRPGPTAPLNHLTARVSTKELTVKCGTVKADFMEVPTLPAVDRSQRVVDAVASIQASRNLKEYSAEIEDRTADSAKVHYRLVGLDPAASGCVADGNAVLVVAFAIVQADNSGGASNTVVQQSSGEISPNLYNVGGSVRIVADDTGQPEPRPNTPPALPPIDFEIAMNPSQHGELIRQLSSGYLSPNLARIRGGVTIEKRGKPKPH